MCICICHMCVYVCVFSHNCTHSGFHEKKNLNLGDCVFYPLWCLRGKGTTTCHRFLNWEKRNRTLWEGVLVVLCVKRHICTETRASNIEYTHTHDLLWTLSHYIMYSSSLEAVLYPHVVQATGDCLLAKWKWLFLTGSKSIPTEWHFRVPLMTIV